jgi:hypothetical protein
LLLKIDLDGRGRKGGDDASASCGVCSISRMKDRRDLFQLAAQQFLLGLSKHLDPFNQFWRGSA